MAKKNKSKSAQNTATNVVPVANTTAYDASKSKQNYKSRLGATDCHTTDGATNCGTSNCKDCR